MVFSVPLAEIKIVAVTRQHATRCIDRMMPKGYLLPHLPQTLQKSYLAPGPSLAKEISWVIV